MDFSNEVDLSNNNNNCSNGNFNAPLWKKRATDQVSNANLKPKPRPLSYQIDGVLMTDFPLEDKCSFTLTQPAETITTTQGTMVIKHVLNKPARKTRVVRSISIGHLSSGRFSLARFRSENNNNEDSVASNQVSKSTQSTKTANGSIKTKTKRDHDPLKRLSSPVTLVSQSEQIVFGDSSPASVIQTPQKPTSPLLNSPQLSSPVALRASSQSSMSSTRSLSSCSSSSSSIPSTPTEQSLSPSEDSGVPPVSRQSSITSQGSDAKSPLPRMVLSTHSPAALKLGTQQLIPHNLASDKRPGKTGQSGGLMDPSKRNLRVRSMVESGSFFSSTKEDEEADSEDAPGLFRRGLRSTSYRRAVVSGVELEVPSNLPRVTEMKEGPRSPRPSKSKSGQKKKRLQSQRTFDSEEDEVLYQNYQEKALHNDSDEDAESRESKADERIVVQYKPIRTSWSQLSVVKKSGVCDQLSQEERKRQEAIFEVISSEHSYLHSLMILIRLFKDSAELRDTMTKTDHHHLFSNIVDVCEASKKFFKELEDRHQQNIVIDDVSDIVLRHAQANFEPYVTYCSNEVYQQRTFQKLVNKRSTFKEVLSRIEAHPDCRNLPMISFLILPMQRVTRLPLLMDTICQKTPKDSPQCEACKKALQSVSKLVRKCNEGARTMERTEMMYTINSQLEFKIKPFPLVSSSRWMVKRGELTAYVEESGIFSRKTTRHQVYFFLFNDVLIVTRKKSDESYTVIDYALRHQIWVGPCQLEDLNLSPTRTTAGMLTSRQAGANHLFRLKFRSNHSGDKVPMVLGAELLNERARWISALGHTNSEKRNVDRTNSMQVEVIRTYTARQPDELSLQVADVVIVSQTADDGWYEGERLRDGERGWFLAECAQPITCQATIEKNMQRMNRLQGLETNV
ncbi:rho guanine nucleotide exchange factor 26-like [Clarias gariepinus]|uniref:rho guanine nucleotide exchange factor 26-like n=1 Tax=Clarias gariepinus TaxID=13013 RepID=UPI00234DEF8D|nr:rho guanine nucleotide exchange factor 26-like [Clarias gariepinus]XP_053356023.1 rho guanine nucleotide exchange factor 26-like [Clarias gariepinus]